MKKLGIKPFYAKLSIQDMDGDVLNINVTEHTVLFELNDEEILLPFKQVKEVLKFHRTIRRCVVVREKEWLSLSLLSLERYILMRVGCKEICLTQRQWKLVKSFLSEVIE